MADDTIKIAIEAVDNASATFEKVGDEVEKLGKRGEEAGDGAAKGAHGFESFAGKLVAVQAGIGVAQEALGTLKKVWDFAKEGAENQRIAESFNRTAKSIGADADEIVRKLDEAARGTVDDEELMQASTRALTLGVAKSGDDLVNVMKLARAAALQFGGDAGQAFETINQAIGNLAPRALKQFGIIVDLKEANAAYAKAIGVTVDALTEEQQRQALLNEVLKQGAKTFKDIGDSATTSGEKIKRFETQIGNLWDVVKEGATSAVLPYLDSLRLLEVTNDKNATQLEKLSAAYDHASSTYGENSAQAKALADAIKELTRLEDELGKTTQEQAVRAGIAQIRTLEQQSGASKAATDAAARHTEVMRAYSAQLLASVDAYQRTKINLADTTALAIQYTEAQQKQGEVQAKLDALNEKIASHGAARSITVKNEKLSTEELTRAQLQLAVAQEDLTTIQRKKDESDAEFALRVDTIKGKIADYTTKLGEHTAVVGGATKAELEQKAALEGQIAALQKTEEINRAKGAFDALTATFRTGALTEEQYRERATALNDIAHLYTDSALAQATAQEVLMKSFADPRSETWRGQLLVNQDALDGSIEKTNKLAESNKKAVDELTKVGIVTPKAVEIPVRPKLDTTANARLAHDLETSARYAPTVTPKVDTTQATKDIQSFTTDKVGAIPKEKTTTVKADTVTATKNTNDILKLFSTIPPKTNTTVDVDAKLALQTLDDVIRALASIFDKTVEVKVKYNQVGTPPEGFQHGGSYVVPPNPAGGSGDYFPVVAAPGERVTVETRAQQNQAPRQGDTYNYTTNVYNPLAAAMLADKQRRERLARSNSRMGVTQ